MNQAGYTLAEVLVALTVLGLTVGGLTLASSQLLRLQTAAAADARAAAAAGRLSAALVRLLDREGPFVSDAASGFVGDTAGFSFPCDGRSCGGTLVRGRGGVELRLRGRAGPNAVFELGDDRAVAFEYADSDGVHDAWPPADAQAPVALRSVVLMRTRLGEERPIAETRIWKEQQGSCVFDPISRACRGEGAP